MLFMSQLIMDQFLKFNALDINLKEFPILKIQRSRYSFDEIFDTHHLAFSPVQLTEQLPEL